MNEKSSARKLTYIGIAATLSLGLLLTGCTQEKPTPTPSPTSSSSETPKPGETETPTTEPTDPTDPNEAPKDERIIEGGKEVVDKYWDDEVGIPKPPISDDVEASWYGDGTETFLILSKGAEPEAVEDYIDQVEELGFTYIPDTFAVEGETSIYYENDRMYLEIYVTPKGVGDERLSDTTSYKVWPKTPTGTLVE